MTSPENALSGKDSGTRLLMALTTPPMAWLPYRSVAAPRTTSMLCADSGSIGTPWSGPMSDTSKLPMPSSSTRTRVESNPRMMGRLAPAAKPEPDTPGTSVKASARLPPPLMRMSSRLTLDTLMASSSGFFARGEAVTTTVSIEPVEAGL